VLLIVFVYEVVPLDIKLLDYIFNVVVSHRKLLVNLLPSQLVLNYCSMLLLVVRTLESLMGCVASWLTLMVATTLVDDNCFRSCLSAAS